MSIELTKTVMKLICSGDRVIVALSGGADSVCLLDILHKLSKKHDFYVCAAHVNHQLRGDESQRDEEFVRTLCKEMDIECFVHSQDVSLYAKQKGISEELAGRKIRYAFFERLINQNSCTKLATAHHKDDMAETIFMHFVRGAGLSGLCGIPQKRGYVIRPLLSVTRAEIEEYCISNNLSYVTDSTNLQAVYTRNKVRLECIPYIKNNFNPNFVDTITKNAQVLQSENDFLKDVTENIYSSVVQNGSVCIESLLKQHIAIRRRIIAMLLENSGFEDICANDIDSILRLCTSNHTGQRISMGNNKAAWVSYGWLYIEQDIKEEVSFCYEVLVGCKIDIPECRVSILLEPATTIDKSTISIPSNASIAVRNRRDGDIFYPEGMEGRKKVKDYFIDKKIPRDERDRIPILTVDGEIACIIGMRRDSRFVLGEKLYRLIIQKN